VQNPSSSIGLIENLPHVGTGLKFSRTDLELNISFNEQRLERADGLSFRRRRNTKQQGKYCRPYDPFVNTGIFHLSLYL
jgi:hypothetical protein